MIGYVDDRVFPKIPLVRLDDSITICKDMPTEKSILFYFDVNTSNEYWKEVNIEDCSAAKGSC